MPESEETKTLQAFSRRGLAPHLEALAGRYVEAMAKSVAILGGLFLVALVALTILSIVGRQLLSLGLGPIPGDFELVEIGCAFAIFCFLPWCQYMGGHAVVDIFVAGFSRETNRVLELFWNTVMTGASCLILWRLFVGMLDKKNFGETTLILEIPLWVSYSMGLLGATVFVLVSLYTMWRSFNDLLSLDGGMA